MIHFTFFPFCQRVRLALEYKKLPFAETSARFYGPEHFQTISGFERLPVIVYSDGSRQSESLEAVLAWRTRISGMLFRLIAPTLPQYPGLGDDTRAMRYYRERMEGRLGDTLEGLQERRHQWYSILEPELAKVIERVIQNGFYTSAFSVADTFIAGDLTGLRLLEGITLPPELNAYFARVETAAGIALLPDPLQRGRNR